ncbi:hypothetical protein [Fusobacterium varium]
MQDAVNGIDADDKKELANLYKGITKGSTRRNRYTSQTLQEAL